MTYSKATSLAYNLSVAGVYAEALVELSTKAEKFDVAINNKCTDYADHISNEDEAKLMKLLDEAKSLLSDIEKRIKQ